MAKVAYFNFYDVHLHKERQIYKFTIKILTIDHSNITYKPRKYFVAFIEIIVYGSLIPTLNDDKDGACVMSTRNSTAPHRAPVDYVLVSLRLG